MIVQYYDPQIDKCCKMVAREIYFLRDQMLLRSGSDEKLIRIKDLYMIIEEEEK